MFKQKTIYLAVITAVGGGAAVASGPADAQDQQLQRVEVTGSAIKRIDAEGALPVQIIRREDIQRSGATSVVDLLQALPAAQGSVGQAAGVGGETLGFAGISLRGLGEQRTLVLLNGRRLTQFGGQAITGFAAAADLNSIPLAAIERIEVLTDGASALYGSDAIAGVVNFITRKNSSEGDISIGGSAPKDGARESRLSATKGIGDIETDKFNILISASADKRTLLRATDRDYANTALVRFSQDGKNYQINSGSPSPIPANIAITSPKEVVSPYFVQNGACPSNTFQFGKRACYYDYVTQLEIYPEQERKNLLLEGALKLPGDHILSAELLYGWSKQTTRIAAVPGSILANSDLLPVPIFDANGKQVTGTVTARYRVADLGPRTNINESELIHTALSLEGNVAGWDYLASLVHSQSKATESIAGYPEEGAFGDLLDDPSVGINPFVGPGANSASAISAIKSTLRDGYYNGGKASLDMLSLRASREVAQLPSGPLSLGVGASVQYEKQSNQPSGLAQGIDGIRFGDVAGVVPYDLGRSAYGAFAELVAPVVKNLEVSGSVRYDKYQEIGETINSKVATRWTPMPGFLLRSSVGAGFRAPTLAQSKAPEQTFGVTANNYDCTKALQAVATSLGAECRPDGDQYDVFAGGTPTLHPERSTQFNFGARLEPTQAISIGVDYWWVGIKDSFGQISESEYFSNPAQYQSLFRSKLASTGQNYLAIFQGNQNLGNTYLSGLDFDVSGRVVTPIGKLTSQLNLTYLIRDSYQLVPNGDYFSSIGRYGEDTNVRFRWQGRLATTLEVSQSWAHTLVANFKSGYHDEADGANDATVEDAAGNPTDVSETVQRRVSSYFTFDWQTSWRPTKSVNVQLGVLNVFDRNPPFSIATGGVNKGQMRGYDDRYYDPRGRTVYANLSYKF